MAVSVTHTFVSPVADDSDPNEVGPDEWNAAHSIIGLGTAAEADTGDFATAAQGALADSATQPGDLATVATTGAYSDLSGAPSLATVATTGDYDDLNNKPTLGSLAALSDLSTFDTGDLSEGSNLYFTDERAQDAVGTILVDSSEIDFTYDDGTPSITATLVAGSIDESKLDTSVNASLDLADSAVQPAAISAMLETTDIGVSVQAWDAQLDTWAGVTPSANGQSLVSAANYAAMRGLLDLEAGTDFLSVSAIAAAYQPIDADLTSWAGVTRAAGFDTFAATPSSANLASLVTGETGTGALVFGTSPAITTPTLTDPQITGAILEDIYTITDGAGFQIDPGNGSIQLITLTANRTPAATNFANGESVTLMVADGTSYTITWTTVAVTWVGGSAPTLATSGYTVIELWKVGGTIYGLHSGDVA